MISATEKIHLRLPPTQKIILFFILAFFFLSLTLFFPRHDTPVYRLIFKEGFFNSPLALTPLKEGFGVALTPLKEGFGVALTPLKEGFGVALTPLKEGFGVALTPLKEGFEDATLPGIDSVIPERENLPLSQYVIKASYLSAFDGKTMSLDQLRFVIQRGCRFLDLEIFPTSDNIPYLGYSIDPTFTIVKGVDINPDKLIYFDKAISTIAANCFSSLSPNPQDPLFIHLRIKSRNRALYEHIAQIIQNKVSSKLYKDARGKLKSVHKDTLLKEIMGKIIFIMDHSIDPQYNLVLGCDTSNNDILDGSGNELLPCLRNVVNIQSGGTQWRTIEYNPPDKNTELGKCGMSAPILDETNKDMTVVKADDSPIHLFYVAPPVRTQFENPDPLSVGIYIAELTCQTIPFMFFKDDNHLNTYEKLFQTYHTAFIPLGYVVSHIRQGNDGHGLHI